VPLNIHHLTPEDVTLMKDMLAVFGEAFNEVQTYTATQPSEAYLRRLLANDYFIALAALDGGSVVGGIVAYELQKFEQQRSEIYMILLRSRGHPINEG
jgi:aminoglycoside 3-N-acetyltransferase I